MRATVGVQRITESRHIVYTTYRGTSGTLHSHFPSGNDPPLDADTARERAELQAARLERQGVDVERAWHQFAR